VYNLYIQNQRPPKCTFESLLREHLHSKAQVSLNLPIEGPLQYKHTPRQTSLAAVVGYGQILLHLLWWSIKISGKTIVKGITTNKTSLCPHPPMYTQTHPPQRFAGWLRAAEVYTVVIILAIVLVYTDSHNTIATTV
jgi:hypothetical protein